MGSITGWVIGVGGLVTSVPSLATYGRAHWAQATRRSLGLLEATRLSPTVTHLDAHALEGLSTLVQRYFRAVLKDGQRKIAAVRVKDTGSFNRSPSSERWKPFTSQRRVVTRSPGFVWNASMNIVPETWRCACTTLVSAARARSA